MIAFARVKASSLTAERLRELLHYEPETGIFRGRVTSGGRLAGDVAGYCSHSGYVEIRVDRRPYYAHRLAWLYVYGIWPSGGIDHRNQIKHDNRIDNLREATGSQNGANTGKRIDNTSGFKGVSWSKQSRRWQAHIRSHGRSKYLGLFDTPEEAHAAYVEAAHCLHGEFARAA